jgi:hypothetical protein
LRSGRKKIPADMEAMLEKLNIQSEAWLETVERYDELFTCAVGSPAGWRKWPNGCRCAR